MKFKIYRTSGKSINHPKCKPREYLSKNSYERFEYIISIESLEELLELTNWISDTSEYTFGSGLIIKPNNEIEIYDTYRE